MRAKTNATIKTEMQINASISKKTKNTKNEISAKSNAQMKMKVDVNADMKMKFRVATTKTQ